MSVVLQISDTHFGTEHMDVMEALLQLVREQSPDIVVVSGDITQRARRRQFRAARQFVKRLAASEVMVLPGNHDIPLFNLLMRIFCPYANYQRAFGGKLEPEFESADLLVLGVNTTRASRHKDGEVSAAQIRRVSQRLRMAKADQLRLVVTHQPVHVTRPEDETNILHGHREAVREWAKAGVDLMLGGHIHLPYVRPLRERFPELQRHVWAVQAGTAVSTRVRDGIPNSVNLIQYVRSKRRKQCVVTRWDYEVSTQRFIIVDRHDLCLSA